MIADKSVDFGLSPHADKIPLSCQGWVAELKLGNFRSYQNLKLEIGPGPVVITGPNGVGKTNLLETISLLAPGRGLRQAALADMARLHPVEGGGATPDNLAISWPPGSGLSNHFPSTPHPTHNSGHWTIYARLQIGEQNLRIGTAWPQQEQNGRLIRLNQEPLSRHSHLQQLYAVMWLTPQMERLLQDNAASRRRFFDRLVSCYHADHAQHITAYEHAMRQRNKLLQSQMMSASWLQAQEQIMAAHGTALAAARLDVLQRLQQSIDDLPMLRPWFPCPVLRLTGILENALLSMPALDVEEAFQEQLTKQRAEDAARGLTQSGPHRTDLLLIHGDKNLPATQCSTGEQKALLTSLILGQCYLLTWQKMIPVFLLLDDISAHFDERRRAALMELICHNTAQCWMSGVEPESFATMAGQAQFFTVKEDGSVVS